MAEKHGETPFCAAQANNVAMCIDRPTRVIIAYPIKATKRIRLGYSKVDNQGLWYEMWDTWRSYTDLRSDGCITEKAQVYSRPEINQALFPLSTHLVWYVWRSVCDIEGSSNAQGCD